MFSIQPLQPNLEPVAVFRERLQAKYNITPATSSLRHLKVPGFNFFQPLIYEAKAITPDDDAVETLKHGKEPHNKATEYGRVMQAAIGGEIVLLEGPHDSGKSTVSRQLCKDWAVHMLGTEFEVVVLVPLRDLKKKGTVDLEDLLTVAYKNLPNGVVQHIEVVDGKGVLFILDGYSEIMSQTEGVPTVIENLLHKSYLLHSSVIVTSRGIAAKGLYENPHLHKRFVIQGLREDEIPVFVSYYFGGSKENTTNIQSLLNMLDADPRLTATCSNTVTLAIVCYLHSKRENIPTTMTGLYGRYMAITLKEFVDRNPFPIKVEMFLRNLTSLLHPGSPFNHMSALTELALKGVLQGKSIFERTDKMVAQFPEGFDGYGLLDSTVITDEFGLYTKLYKFNFLHLTLQEFMAALFVASRAPEEQALFWRKHLAMQYRGYSHVVQKDHFLTMLTFYCGLTGLENKGVQEHLLAEVNNLWTPSSQLGQTLVKICHLAVESSNKEFACALLSLLGKKAEVNVDNRLDSANVAWCLAACKENFEELVVVHSGNSVRPVAYFLSQLNQLTSLSILDLPYMVCSTEILESTCSKGTVM